MFFDKASDARHWLAVSPERISGERVEGAAGMITTIEATHSDGDGQVLIAIGGESNAPIYLNLDKEQAMAFMANLAMAIADEYGKGGYSYPGCKA